MKTALAMAAALLALPVAATAQNASLGEREYMNSCASCHGADGTGNGPLAELLSVQLPDLTTLEANNDGVFPVSDVYEIIDGTSMAAGHGSREMPVWGDRYSAEGNVALGEYFTEEDREAFVRARILALVEYISTIQE